MQTRPTTLGPLASTRVEVAGPNPRVTGVPPSVWTWSEANIAGFSDKMIWWRLRTRRWQLIHPRTLVTYSGPFDRTTRLAAALLYAGEGAALDGPTAAALHGLNGYGDEIIHVRVAHHRHPEKQRGLVIRRTRNLEPRSAVERHGYRCLRVERAVLTIAAPRIGVLAAAVQQGLTTADRLRGVLLSLGPIKGRARMLHALDDISGGSRSDLERDFLRILRRGNLPLPVRNHPLRIEGRRLWLDAAWPELRIFAEIDGRAYHLMSEDWEDDLERQNLIVIDGWRPLRFSTRAIRDRPDTVDRTARRALLG